MNLLVDHLTSIENLQQFERTQFSSITNDPQLWFSFKKPLEYGWYRVRLNIKFKNLTLDNITAKIYFDFGRGFSEESAHVFNVKSESNVDFYVKLNADCRQIRLDPHENAAGGLNFEIKHFYLTRLNKYSVFINQFARDRRKTNSVMRQGIKSLASTIGNIKKDIKLHVIEHVEFPKSTEPVKNIFVDRIFEDTVYFLRNRNEDYKEKREFKVVNTSIKPIAFYLPQYHATPVNNKNWGEGFTEWTNVTKAFSQFNSHYQPHLPGELGFYDLTDVNVIRKQAALARHYGIHGFCVYHYWFDGKRVLEKPLDLLFENKDIDINFMLCWANENWTKRWDGLDTHILLKQNHTQESDARYLDSVVHFFDDARYIKVDDKPVLMIYRPALFPDFKSTVALWRKRAAAMGLPGIYLMAVKGFGCENAEQFGLDALVEFPPATPAGYIELDTKDELTVRHSLYNKDFEGKVYDYRKVAANLSKLEYSDNKTYKGIMPAWDNTARRNNDGHIFHFSSPSEYRTWLYKIAKYTNDRFDEKNRFIFINAWNEWAEGTHLEPDRYYGHSVLDKTAQVLDYFPAKVNKIKPKSNEVAFCIHIFHYDLWPEIKNNINNLGQKYNLFISLAEKENARETTDLKARILKDFSDAKVKIVKNRGKDIYPLLVFIDEIVESGCKYLCRIHSKKSPHRTDGDKWRKELYGKLMQNQNLIDSIYSYFEKYPEIGIIGPDGHLLNTKNYWGENKSNVYKLAEKLQFDIQKEFFFVAGGMFWIRTDVLKTLKNLNLKESDFEEEKDLKNIKDGTLCHAVERIFSILAEMQNKIVIDTRIFYKELNVDFSEIVRPDPNNYPYAIPIPQN